MNGGECDSDMYGYLAAGTLHGQWTGTTPWPTPPPPPPPLPDRRGPSSSSRRYRHMAASSRSRCRRRSVGSLSSSVSLLLLKSTAAAARKLFLRRPAAPSSADGSPSASRPLNDAAAEASSPAPPSGSVSDCTLAMTGSCSSNGRGRLTGRRL